MTCNQGQGFTACGVDSLMVVCSFDPVSKSGCLHDTGPCHAGLNKDGYSGECQGRSQYAAHLPSEKMTRPMQQYHQVRAALSLAVEALCNMTYDWYNDRARREDYFQASLKKIRGAAGDVTLTKLQIECAWCDPPRIIGQKEGNGAVGVTSTICPDCLKKQLGKDVPAEVRRIAAAVGLAIGDVKDDAEARKGISEIYEGLERRGPVEVAASTGPCMVGETFGGV